MSTTILIRDNQLAFSSLLHDGGEQMQEWPHTAYWTPYGFIAPFNYNSTMILDYLEWGRAAFTTPFMGDGGAITPRDKAKAVMIDACGDAHYLILSHSSNGKVGSVLSRQRILTGPGAKYVVAETIMEHEKAMMSLRLKDDMDSALDLYLTNCSFFQHVYEVYDIEWIAKELCEMGMDLPFPSYEGYDPMVKT